MQIIITVVIILLCAGAYLYIKHIENRKNAVPDKDAERQITAQEFINIKDVGENCLYTLDGNVYAFIQIEGLCLELFTNAELMSICKISAAGLSKYRREFKYIAVSRPADIAMTIRDYAEMYSAAEGGRRKLLKEDMEDLAEKVMSGETLERQHYFVIWGNLARESEHEVIKSAHELSNILNEKLTTWVLDKRGIIKLCDLVNNPAYVHIENTDGMENALAVLQMAGNE
jgi:hypothetical protein